MRKPRGLLRPRNPAHDKKPAALANMERLATVFGIGALSGIVNELVQNPNHWCITSPNAKAVVTCTVGNIYGYSAVAATLLFDAAAKRNVPWWLQVLAATLVVSGIEGVSGAVSKKFHNGKQTWKYPPCWGPLFGGSVSLVSTAYFSVGIMAFYWLIYKPFLTI